MIHTHISCGGNLEYLGKKSFNVRNKVITKDIFHCDKCNQDISCFLNPSYDDYVLAGKIRVSWWELRRVKNKYKTNKTNFSIDKEIDKMNL